jgi:hypothetical protein
MMAKKQSRSKSKGPRRRTPPRPRRSGAPPPIAVLTKIIITKDTQKPLQVTTFRNGPAAWLILNVSGAAHTVTIDPQKFKFDLTPDNPLTTDTPLTTPVPDKGWGVLLGVIRRNADEGLYTYEIELENMLTTDRKEIDPDLDVVDPKP